VRGYSFLGITVANGVINIVGVVFNSAFHSLINARIWTTPTTGYYQYLWANFGRSLRVLAYWLLRLMVF